MMEREETEISHGALTRLESTACRMCVYHVQHIGVVDCEVENWGYWMIDSSG